MTTARVATKKVHDMHYDPNPTKTDTTKLTESDSHVDTTCAGNNMTLFNYTG